MMNGRELQRIIRFLIIGGSATVIDIILYVLLSNNINILLAKLISMTISCTYSFFLNKNWTFRVQGKVKETYIIKYIITQCINICINAWINYVFVCLWSNKVYAYILATATAMIVNFLLQRFYVFKKVGDRE